MEPINSQRLEKQLREKYRQILPCLNERQKRLITAADAVSIGYKGVSIVSRVIRAFTSNNIPRNKGVR